MAIREDRMPNQIAIEGSVVRLEGITIQNPDVSQYLSQKTQEERAPALIRAIEVGIYCLQRAEVGQSLDFVRLEVERLIQTSSAAVDQLPESIREKLAAADGPTAQVSAVVVAAQAAIRDKLAEVQQLFERHLDPAKPDATLGKALSSLNNLLDPRRDDSVQKRLDATLQGLAVGDGAIAKAVRATVETAIAPLQAAIETFSLALKKEEGIGEALATTTQKGFAFEEDLLPELRRWAATLGADFEYTAPQNLPGDFTLALNETSIGGMPLKIVVEARDREQSFGRARILEQMDAALAQWKANYGIYVSKTQSGLAAEVGDWSELSCRCGPVIACTVEHLRTALRFAVVETRLRAAVEARRELDIGAAEKELARFRTSLNHLTQIKRKVGEIREVLPAIEDEADRMRSEVQDALNKIDTLLSPAVSH
jgi:hypothetical protein